MTNAAAAPIAEDLSAYIIAGAVSSVHGDSEHETDCRTPRQGIEDGVAAERLGFRRVFLSERWDIKEAGVILSGVAARTSRIEVGTGVIDPPTRHPWQTAAFAATMQACYGPRLVLGLGRGDAGYFPDMGLKVATYAEIVDYVDIIRQLWRGETVTYEGPVGSFPAMAFSDVYQGPPPPVWFAGFARRRGARVVASSFDGVLLPPMLTPAGTRRAVGRIHDECERIGRDPATVRICQPVVTAPDLRDSETRAIAHGRAVGYLQYAGYGDILAEENGWDVDVIHEMRQHKKFQGLDKVADRTFHRQELLEPAELLPDEWMKDCCAIGSVDECVTSLRRYRDAGADEIATYGSTPEQNAGLIAAWRAATPSAG